MNNRHKMGLAVLAGGLTFVGAASAADLIVNGSFETTGGWKGFFSTYNISTHYFAGPSIPASENAGTKFSWKHTGTSGVYTPATPVTQLVNLTAAITGPHIDAGLGQFNFSAWLASYGNPGSNPEQPYLTLQFFDAGSNQVGSTVVFDRAIPGTTAGSFWVGEVSTDGNSILPASDPTAVEPDASNHFWAKYSDTATVPPGARSALVGIKRSPNAGLTGTPDTYVDLVKLDVQDVSLTTPGLSSAVPSDGSTNLPPGVTITVTLQDRVTAVNPGTIQLQIDGSTANAGVQKSGTITTVQYTIPVALLPFSTHTYKITYSDNGSVVTTQSQQFQFTIGGYVRVTLPPPIVFENFNSTAEGTLPPGWSQTNYTDVNDANFDLGDINSAAYQTWVVVDSARFNNPLLSYATHTSFDYSAVLSQNPLAVQNGLVVSSLARSNMLFATAGYRTGISQVEYVTTPDFDTTGKNNVSVAFHSLYTQNQDSIGTLEYSIDQGATWLPVVYLINGPALIFDAHGNVDAYATLATDHSAGQTRLTDVPVYNDPNTGLNVGGNYGAFVGVASNLWAGLAPNLSARVDDDQVESKRIELYRLQGADNQAHVRLRFGYAGTDSWYWGIDDFGLYSVDPATIAAPIVSAPTPSSQIVAVGNATQFSVSVTSGGILHYQWRRNGVPLAGNTGPNMAIPAATLADAGTYDVIVTNDGGASVSASPAATLTVINPPSVITGQWDFKNGDLKATAGTDLQPFDATVTADTTFGSASSFGLPLIGTNDANVMHFVPSVLGWGGYRMTHGAQPNGGGAFVNQYTIIYDVLYPGAVDLQWRALIQSDITNTTDAEVFINNADGIGISSVYSGRVTPDVWHRIAIAFDLSGPGTAPVLTKFLDGVKVGQQTTGLSGIDGRFSLGPVALLFADNDSDNQEAYVSSVQFSSGRKSDAYLAALGGASAGKIPGLINASFQAGHTVITWSGDVGIESASSLNGPWQLVAGATSPYTVTAPTTAKFYRIVLH